MDMSEVARFEGFDRNRKMEVSAVLRWLADEIRKPSQLLQARGAFFFVDQRAGKSVEVACALGKVQPCQRVTSR